MSTTKRINLTALLVLVGASLCLLLLGGGRASAAPTPTPSTTVSTTVPTAAVPTAAVPTGAPTSAVPVQPVKPTLPTPPAGTASAGNGQVTVNLGGSLNKPSSSITIIIALTLLTVAPALLIMLTSFTRIIIVLSLTRNALGLQAVPPNQVLTGLALFLTLFIMSPVISQVNSQAVQPYLHNQITESQAFKAGEKPLQTWMLKQTRTDDIAIFETGAKPKSAADVPMTTLVPAFIISELKTGFIIGFIIFIPFLVIDLIVSSSLMSMGMMMLPPSLVSLPFKLLLFVLVDGWALIAKSLITSFH